MFEDEGDRRSAVLTGPELGVDAVCEDEEANAEGFGSLAIPYPYSPPLNGPLQQPAIPSRDPSCAPQRQWVV